MGKKNRKSGEAKPPKKKRVPFVERAFEGMAGEPVLVAMREIIPAGTTTLTTTEEYGSRTITLATILPGLAAATRREDGELLVAAQLVTQSGDASRDLAAAIIEALELEPGEAMPTLDLPEPGPRLQDVVVDEPLELTLHEDFSFWVGDEEAARPEVAEAIEQTRENIVPTAKVDGVDGAFWCRMTHEFVRWVRPEDQDAVLDGLARLHAVRELTFDEARFVGAFRANGLLIPVWQLPAGAEADELPAPMSDFAAKLDAAINLNEPLTPEEKRARAGIVSRQVTLR